ncbi:GNAT family N-acetyltransferase [Brachybacterium sp. FME24]|uniref:GNAT family N-acetyltransferase n=1 Tax=Brachybacterium sp. FME24 TaxID=2742605 RepID=UPI0018695CF4|nr:GNAT family N-acetyltransferase [Brachybacterium sp. FME24]
MEITVRPLQVEDAEAMVAAEDEETVRWLTGGRSTVEGTRRYVRHLETRAATGSTKRAFTIRVDGHCVGSIDHDADPQDGIGPGDVNIAYTLAPWMRGLGITARAVGLLCAQLGAQQAGERAVIRCETDNVASVRVAEKAGFSVSHEVPSTNEHGEPVQMQVYVREL